MLSAPMPVDRARRLTKHYLLGDLLVDETFPALAAALEPDAHTIANLERLAAVLERLAEQFAGPWRVLSGYRDARLNEAWAAAGMAASVASLHLDGCAADVVPRDADVDLEAVFEWLRAAAHRDLPVHEAVYYPQKGYLHVAVESPRRATAKRFLLRT
jgi:uncharacterized protein YcbK (DUF882 family)